MGFDSFAPLIVVVANRFRLASESEASKDQFYTKEELEEKLEGEELPSFLTVGFGDTSPKARQFGAICALQEFQKRLAAQTA